jgi:ankyrin repeat protein
MVTPVCQAARAGTLTQKQLLDWTLTGGFINEKNSNGVTPLCSAAIGGHPNVVRFLLQNGAQVNEPSHHDCTALWFATRLEDEEKAYRITNTLLRAGADVNCVSSATILNTTPLMNAIRNGLGMKVLSLLLTNKASQDHPVKKKHSGTEDAKFIDNKQYIDALKDPSEVLSPAASKSFIVKSVNSLFEYMVAVVNRFTNNALTDKLGIRGSTSDLPRVGVSFPEVWHIRALVSGSIC